MNARKGPRCSSCVLIQCSMLTPENVNTGRTWCSVQGEGCPPCFVWVSPVSSVTLTKGLSFCCEYMSAYPQANVCQNGSGSVQRVNCTTPHPSINI